MTVSVDPRLGGLPHRSYLLLPGGDPVTRSSLNTADDAVESNALLFTIPANVLVGRNRIYLHGAITTTNVASSTKIVAVRLGPTSMGNLPNITTVAQQQISCVIRADGTSNGQYVVGTPASGFHGASNGSIVTNNQDCTQPVDLKIVWRWTAAVAGETMTLHDYFVELIPGP